ncbi:MAG: D-tyrosyl-tRNA(Tyr) deacylase [Jatrophihabitans sp.]|nr:MAG: D-tyrosyl-tRNA(Tyr) deacylase [Jatrophihabitans sp.]
MRAVLQRVSSASVAVAGHVVAEIGSGLLALVGVAHGDTGPDARAMARKIAGLRILRGQECVLDHPCSAVLVVSQFTVYGDTRRGRRPTWSAAAPGPVAEPLVANVVATLRDLGVPVRTGVFGADMQVSLVNDGPVTVLVHTGAGGGTPGAAVRRT